jgi:hypothetical protein
VESPNGVPKPDTAESWSKGEKLHFILYGTTSIVLRPPSSYIVHLPILKQATIAKIKIKMNVDIEWIDLSKAPLGTNETRAKVRSHAMKATAASRKQTGTWGKRNLRQLPGSRITNEIDQGNSSSMPDDETSTDQVSGALVLSASPGWYPTTVNISPAMPLAGIELLAAEFGVHILDLSALTAIQCGWTACALLASGPSWINGLVGRRRPSYLHCVASRYGSNSCLDDALRCVAIRARRVLAPSGLPVDRSESLQYVAALKSLQKAVDDVEGRSQPEVLGAINLLSLFEVGGRRSLLLL